MKVCGCRSHTTDIYNGCRDTLAAGEGGTRGGGRKVFGGISARYGFGLGSIAPSGGRVLGDPRDVHCPSLPPTPNRKLVVVMVMAGTPDAPRPIWADPVESI